MRVSIHFDDVPNVPGAVRIVAEPDIEPLLRAPGLAGVGLTPAQTYALFCLRMVERQMQSGKPIHLELTIPRKKIQ